MKITIVKKGGDCIHSARYWVAAAALLLAVGGCAPPATPPADSSAPPTESIPPAAAAAPPAPAKAVLLAAGDNLIHDVIYQQAARRTDGTGYDFTPVYAQVAPLLAEADFAFINQETVLAGDAFAPSSYPLFCSPTQVGDAVLAAGFNLIATANNHSYDKGVAGLEAAGAYWDSQSGIAVAGAYRTAAERDQIAYLTKNGLTVALVAAAEQTNGLTLPADSAAGVPLLSDLDRLTAKLREAGQNADLVVLSLHWGIEGSDKPTDDQRTLARQLANAGADLILGHHPHVLQQGEWLDTPRGRCYVAYSLGNFVSAQVGANNLAGGLLRVELTHEPDQPRATLQAVGLLPTVTHYGPGFAQLSVYPFADYTAALAAQHGVHRHSSRFSYDYLQQQLAALQF